MKMNINSKIKLNNGIKMPIFGLGTYLMQNGRATENAVLWALEAGYRHIDTAALYGNEESIGKAIRQSGIPRDEIFVTTKLWNSDHGDPIKAFNISLKKLQIDYVDLYLIHWPVKERINTWKTLEKLGTQCRAIGVSNFTIRHLAELLDVANIIPTVNQVEFSPYLYQKDLLNFCVSKNIQLEAYSPLTRGSKFNDQKLLAIASKYSKTPVQILIRWSLQHNLVAIPKSSKKERIIENANVFDFEISKDDMKKLDSFNENLHVSWDPTDML